MSDILAAAMRHRTEQGFRLVWFIPSEGRTFVAYAKDESQKQAWLARGPATPAGSPPASRPTPTSTTS